MRGISPVIPGCHQKRCSDGLNASHFTSMFILCIYDKDPTWPLGRLVDAVAHGDSRPGLRITTGVGAYPVHSP